MTLESLNRVVQQQQQKERIVCEQHITITQVALLWIAMDMHITMDMHSTMHSTIERHITT